MKTWKINPRESSNFTQKTKKGKRQINPKNQKMGGAREARAPHFLICCNFSFISLFQFFGKVANFQKINFPFFHVFRFSLNFIFFVESCKMALTLEGWTTSGWTLRLTSQPYHVIWGNSRKPRTNQRNKNQNFKIHKF